MRYKSPAVERILGYGEEELVGTKVFGYIHPDDLDNVKRTFAEALESPGVHPPVQFRFRHANGSWRCIEAIRNNLLKDPNVRGIVVNTRDITERKEAEEALRKSEASLAEAQSLAHLGNWEWDVKTSELFWSDEVFRIYGYETKESVPTLDRFMELVHPDDRELISKKIDDALYESKPFEFEHRIVRPDGEERILHCQAKVYFDEEGEPSRMIGTAHDISEQKEAEKALKESEERFRTAFEDAPVGVALVGLDGRRFRVNRALCEMLGYSEEELLGKLYLEDIHPEDREISADRLRQVLKVKAPIR
jgi:PAS domain S-box-containing protein